MQQFFSNGNLLPSLHLLINTVSVFIDKLPMALSIHMPYVSLPFILADVDVEAVKGEMPWQRSLSRCRNREGKVVTLILSPLKQGKVMNFKQGPLGGFSGASTASPAAQLDASCFLQAD